MNPFMALVTWQRHTVKISSKSHSTTYCILTGQSHGEMNPSRVRTDLHTDAGSHPVHCRSTWCRSNFVDQDQHRANGTEQLLEAPCLLWWTT